MGKIRSTRKLRCWMVDQVNSGKYPGLMWDDEAKTMFRIPWKHAGKQDFRSDEDAAIFKAWAEFKGKLTEGDRKDPASWKTRLRCALNKSPEFTEVMERSQLDISEPYKVYRLVPISEQGMVLPVKKCREKSAKRQRQSNQDPDDQEELSPVKQMKEDATTSQLYFEEDILFGGEPTPIYVEEPVQQIHALQDKGMADEIQLDVRIETAPTPLEEQGSFHVDVHYIGREVLGRDVLGNDLRILYLPPSVEPPTNPSLIGGFPRITLPEPSSSSLTSCPETSPKLQALATLLPYMERGVVLTTMGLGVYARRFCAGRVFWTGPHTTSSGVNKMERNKEPVLLFSKEVFRQQLDYFRENGGEPPRCGVTLCFGEELKDTDDPSDKLIVAQITFPWAERQLQDIKSFMESISILQSLASQSQSGEIILNLLPVSPSVQSQAS
ncbi:interferon regulatory factor 9 [Lampris incognitus]|uniref:interferon regulatory factor 9 n=1 Tax=Lampris incognitus TaxID=2546036 RepID=UPI0024B53664|nr:interferon regulatory factor 9 [Lampris incognitus]